MIAWTLRDGEPSTEVEVLFTASDTGTVVELEHRGWERLESDVVERYRGYAAGWTGALQRFRAAAEHRAA